MSSLNVLHCVDKAMKCWYFTSVCLIYGMVFADKKMKTQSYKQKDVIRKWHIVDARGRTLGRVASRVARVLEGKHKPAYTPNIDSGDFVVVVNAKDVVLTGKKMKQKMVITHSLYPGGLRSLPVSKVLAERPERIFENAVRGMLPKNRLGEKMFKKLKVYKGSEHPHQSQKPEPLAV